MNGLGMYKVGHGYVVGYAVFCEYVATDWFAGEVKEASLEVLFMN